MFGMMRNPAESYAKVGVEGSVEAADPHKLILMLFDGAIAAIAVSKNYMIDGNIPLKGSHISKAIDIITNGLRVSLDMESGGELAERLSALYEYMTHRLLWANLKNQTAPLDEVLNLLNELRGAWAEIAPNQQDAA